MALIPTRLRHSARCHSLALLRIGHWLGEADSLLNIGNGYFQQERMVEALESYMASHGFNRLSQTPVPLWVCTISGGLSDEPLQTKPLDSWSESAK